MEVIGGYLDRPLFLPNNGNLGCILCARTNPDGDENQR